MCQGAIVSLVQFKKSGRNKRIILKGIGSYADLIADNVAKLKRAGWDENLPGQKVYSIVSDFSAWNRFSVVSGDSGKKELNILAEAYREIAGKPSALIRHVLKCGKVDDALANLLLPKAKKEYSDKRAKFWKEYDDKRAKFWKEYSDKRAKFWKEYDDKRAKFWKEYDDKRAKFWKEYNDKCAKFWKEYNDKCAQLFVHLFRVKSNRIECLR
jgi:hypothetical protein